MGERAPTKVVARRKAVAVNPLKQSQPLGAALAYLGVKGIMPLFHGSQGCTAFAKVMLVRHFREAIPIATTAMTEVTTILGRRGQHRDRDPDPDREVATRDCGPLHHRAYGNAGR
jgi:nitrogenase molybdenum-iron protein alpha/beta subunit